MIDHAAVVSLVVDEAFAAVGHYYADFTPVTDDEVAMLARAAEHVPNHGRAASGAPTAPPLSG